MHKECYCSVASPKLIMYVLIAPAIVLLFPFVFLCLLSPNHLIQNSLIFVALYLALCGIGGLAHRNAFCRFKMTATGIGNKYWHIKWEDIDDFKLCSVEILKYNILPTIQLPSLICIGTVPKCSFLFLNPKQCVFFSATPQNLNMLKEYSKKDFWNEMF